VQFLKPGGTLAHSTCSFSPEENEAVINHILKKFPQQLELQPITLPINNVQQGLTEWHGKTFDPSLARSIRIFTQRTDGWLLSLQVN
jgi:16S rRNA (cytosine1407-C5)-methyltransferase